MLAVTAASEPRAAAPDPRLVSYKVKFTGLTQTLGQL
jgi:hypothetical protein